jgi:hypothetical protein
MFNPTTNPLARVSFIDGVTRRSFGLVKHDFWLQIDPSVSRTELVTS